MEIMQIPNPKMNKIGSCANGYYFFQTKDGSKVFLHPFSVSVLKEEFKTSKMKKER